VAGPCLHLRGPHRAHAPARPRPPAPRPRLSSRATGPPAVGVGPRPHRRLLPQRQRVDRGDVRGVEGACCVRERQLSLRRRRAALHPGDERRARDHLPCDVRPAAGGGARPAAGAPPPRPGARRLGQRAPARRRRLRSMARRRARGPDRAPLLRRRPLRAVHRRHDGHAEGGPLAARGRLLQWARRPRAGVRAARQRGEAPPPRRRGARRPLPRAAALHARRRAVGDVQHLPPRRHRRPRRRGAALRPARDLANDRAPARRPDVARRRRLRAAAPRGAARRGLRPVVRSRHLEHGRRPVAGGEAGARRPRPGSRR